MKLQDIITTLEKSVNDFAGDNSGMINDINESTFYGIDYFGENADDAFSGGREYGEYEAELELLQLLKSVE